MRANSRHAEINVRAPSLSRTGDGRWRVSADVNGAEVYLTADDSLVANGDVWASMMLMPAARDRATLRVEADIDARLKGNFERIQAIARSYWGFRGARVVADRLVQRTPTGGEAMFFTCGVDSFYTLWKRKDTVERLIFVRGLNINLVDPDDTRLWDQARNGVANVARECGIRAVLAETNLRVDPTFSRVDWDVSHIAALAGVAHALAPAVSRIYIASSDIPAPYGSRPELDPLWTSGAVEIINDGSEQLKPGKVRAIADWPLVHRHLRVCHEPGSTALNCGACLKCVRTQLLFEIAGTRERLETFPRTPLVELIDGMKWIEERWHFLWEQLVPDIRDPKIVAAIARLLARRPSAIERLQAQALWLRKTAPGRAVRKIAKRLLVE